MRRIRLAGLTWLHHIKSFALIVFACILMYTVYFQGLSVCVEDLIWKLWQVDHTGAEFCSRKPCEHPAMEAAVSICQACHSDDHGGFFFGNFRWDPHPSHSITVTCHQCFFHSTCDLMYWCIGPKVAYHRDIPQQRQVACEPQHRSDVLDKQNDRHSLSQPEFWG